MLGLGRLWHYATVAREALREERARTQKPKLQKDEREFQAAAIEILETPASPTARLLAASLIGLFLIALIWSILGRLDIHAVLEGKVVPVGLVKVIEPLVTGTVKSIHVRQGQEIAEGDLLITLDPTEPAADRTRLEEDFQTSQVISARLHTAIAAGEQDVPAGKAQLPAIADAPLAVRDLQAHMLRQTLAALNAEQATIAADIGQKGEELRRIERTVAERERLIELLNERVGMIENLTKTGSASRASYLESAQLLFQQRAELAEDQGQIPEIRAAIAALERRADERKQNFLQEQAKQLEENERRLGALRQELTKARQKEAQSRLFAPVAGTVQQLSVFTIGEVVMSGQQLMIVVPAGTRLEVEANLLNRDKGFVREGQEARVKVESFNFTKYGVIDGQVVSVSNDAVNLNPAPQQSGGRPASPLMAGQGPLIFPVKVALSQETIWADGENVRLTPGMSVTVEVKTGNRRVIEYFLSPLMKMKDEALRER
jgi:hemolysin D